MLLGQGGYGEVRKCVSRSDKVVRAVKIIKKESITSEEHETFKNEMNIFSFACRVNCNHLLFKLKKIYCFISNATKFVLYKTQMNMNENSNQILSKTTKNLLYF